MAFPNSSEIQTAAATSGADPIVLYAFAAMHGRLPNPTNGELAQFEAQVSGSGVWGAQTPDVYKYGYIEAFGGFPPQGYYFVNWLKTNAYMDASGNLMSAYPFAGEGYPPGNQATDAMPASPTTPAPAPGLLSGLQLDGKTILIGAAVLGAGWYAFGRHR